MDMRLHGLTRTAAPAFPPCRLDIPVDALPHRLLEMHDGMPRPVDPTQHRRWQQAIRDVSCHRVARFYVLQQAPHWVVAALVPDVAGTVHVRLSESAGCGGERLQAAARMLGLTPRETDVLGLLLQGGSSTSIASQLGTSICTVRTQLAAIRNKCGLSLRELVRLIAELPPLRLPNRDDDNGLALASLAR